METNINYPEPEVDNVLTGVAGARVILDEFKSTDTDELDLQQLSLTNEEWSEIANDVIDLAPRIRTLNLFMNNLTTLPKEIGQCTNLERLFIGCNPLVTIEDDVCDGLRNLKELDIGFGESLETLPDTIGQLGMLEKLFVGNCRLKELPSGLFRCEALQELYAYGNCLKAIPEDVGKLKSLRVLNIGRNQITKLPNALGLLPSLEKIYVYENNIKCLPKGLGQLPNLNGINVDGNCELPVLPKDIRLSGDPKLVAAFYATR